MITILGNVSLLEQENCGFLCSRHTQSSVILPCLDWAMGMSKGNVPVISTFHSEMEQAVFDILLAGSCPIIVVLGRSLYKRVPEKYAQAMQDGRLAFVSVSDQKRISRESAFEANSYVAKHAHKLVFGFLSPDSSLYPLYKKSLKEGKNTKVIEILA